MLKFFKFISALFHIRQKDVCELSQDMGLYDFHDYRDSTLGEPIHWYLLECKHCGKKFYI
jgi:hypothetical protein